MISVCIPAYSMGGEGRGYLSAAFESLARQTLSSFEVVVADQSDDTEILDLCRERRDLNVRHVRTRHVKRQASANTNAAIDLAQGNIIKVLFQDDFLNDSDALEKICKAFDDPSVEWCLTGSEHTRDGENLIRPFVPEYHSKIHFGKNTVSSPSVLAIRRHRAQKFDENLTWLMDVDYYKRCALKLGLPEIIPDPLVVNRLHESQVSAGIDRSQVRRELKYIREKYRANMSLDDWFHYLGRLRKTFA